MVAPPINFFLFHFYIVICLLFTCIIIKFITFPVGHLKYFFCSETEKVDTRRKAEVTKKEKPKYGGREREQGGEAARGPEEEGCAALA